jgi:heptosyltransferase-2
MQKFLIIQTAFIGDVILATAVLEKLHRFFPDNRLDLLVRQGNEGLLNHHPFLGKVWVWEKQKRKYTSLFQVWRAIRRENYEAVINLQRFASTGFLTAFSGAAQRIGFNKNPFSFAFTHRLPHRFGTEEEAIHEVDRNLSLIGHLTDGARTGPRLYPSDADYQRVKQQEPYVCMAPTSVWFTKQWPAEKWIDLIDRMPARLRVFLLGGPPDQDACESIAQASRHPRVKNMAGKLTFLESVALMEKAQWNYVNDSAPLHMASSVNAPTVAVFCSTVPRFGFFPLSDRSIVVETSEPLDCRPCGLHGKRACPEQHFRCSNIEPDLLLAPLKQKE